MMFYFDKVVLVEIQHRTFKHRIFFLIASQCKTIACYYNEVQMPCNGFCGCAENSCENNFNEQVLENEENEDDGGNNGSAEDNETDVHLVDNHHYDFWWICTDISCHFTFIPSCLFI